MFLTISELENNFVNITTQDLTIPIEIIDILCPIKVHLYHLFIICIRGMNALKDSDSYL